MATTNWPNLEEVENYVEQHGNFANPNAGFAIATVVGAESQGNTGIVNSIGAEGLFQDYDQSRQAGLTNFLAANGLTMNSVDGQTGYALSEIASGGYPNTAAILNDPNASVSAIQNRFINEFENPGAQGAAIDRFNASRDVSLLDQANDNTQDADIDQDNQQDANIDASNGVWPTTGDGGDLALANTETEPEFSTSGGYGTDAEGNLYGYASDASTSGINQNIPGSEVSNLGSSPINDSQNYAFDPATGNFDIDAGNLSASQSAAVTASQETPDQLAAGATLPDQDATAGASATEGGAVTGDLGTVEGSITEQSVADQTTATATTASAGTPGQPVSVPVAITTGDTQVATSTANAGTAEAKATTSAANTTAKAVQSAAQSSSQTDTSIVGNLEAWAANIFVRFGFVLLGLILVAAGLYMLFPRVRTVVNTGARAAVAAT